MSATLNAIEKITVSEGRKTILASKEAGYLGQAHIKAKMVQPNVHIDLQVSGSEATLNPRFPAVLRYPGLPALLFM